MSRSIHTTRQTLKKLRRQELSTEELQQEALAKAARELQRKRRIKRNVGAERREPEVERTVLPVDAVPITMLDRAPFVFHAASAEDVRALIALLPPAAVLGVDEVRLFLGNEYMAERRDEARATADPLSGRLGCELFPGVYSGNVLGTYFPSRGRIDLYAYVVDWRRLTVPRLIVELFLRLQALKTLMHELAHFHDRVERVRRGRWLADRHENLEWYAEKMEHQWTAEFVVPYLERRYGKECRQFRAWVRQRGGIELPIGFFGGDSRRTERNGITRMVFSTAGAFESWLGELPRCLNPADARLALAWELHFADYYEECLAILNGILAAEPARLKAKICRADTLVHLERYDEALADADTVIAVAPEESRAWEVRLDVFEGRKDWAGLLVECSRWDAVPRVPLRDPRECHRYRAIAHCALGNAEGMETSLAAYAATFRFKSHEAATRRMGLVRRSVFRRAGKPLPA